MNLIQYIGLDVHNDSIAVSLAPSSRMTQEMRFVIAAGFATVNRGRKYVVTRVGVGFDHRGCGSLEPSFELRQQPAISVRSCTGVNISPIENAQRIPVAKNAVPIQCVL
jgi:hypothetical protein